MLLPCTSASHEAHLFYREVRKDMINYCEESGTSSSTDEEELCRPRTLRHRDNNINYSENKRGDSDSDRENDGRRRR